CLRFCPRHPQHLLQLSTPRDALASSQREFWALRLGAGGRGDEMREESFGLEDARTDGVLAAVASTYSRENDALYDGVAREGVPVVTFAPVLKQKLFPLPDVLDTLMQVGERGMGTPVEIEFAVNLHVPAGRRREFGFLQIRPLALSREAEELAIGDVD